ncbi:hypothetical protein FSP39_001943 [Pinctada imbricata]|uniref:Uncharacterized protein n=1 Tax=Pinctada imbricata TaxID=66713 RepID=A0AA89BWN4_PINIB|nr:hypothetical protein FSP39_001943 [Pinctada imbricata]
MAVNATRSPKKNGGFSMYDYLSAGYNNLTHKPIYEQFGFFIGILGPGCNCCTNKSFTDAECDSRPFRRCDERDCGTIRRPSLKFREVFNSAFTLLRSLLGEEDESCTPKLLIEDEFENLEVELSLAVDALYDYFEKKGDHEKALKKVLVDNKHSSKAEITTVVAEHLFGPLAQGRYKIDSRTTLKDNLQECACGCRSKVKYGSTGIGHEKVWHGFADILLQSPDNSLNAAVVIAHKVELLNDHTNGLSDQDNTPPSKKLKIKGESLLLLLLLLLLHKEKSPNEENIHVAGEISSHSGYENQAVSQTFVCSMIQRRKRPYLRHYLVPNIVISDDEFYIIMYDPDKDNLLCSPKYPIFGDSDSALAVPVIFIFWMVLHHRLFCAGVPERDFLNEVKSNFKLRAADAWPIYNEQLKENVSSFPLTSSTGLECDITTYYKEVSFDVQ